MPDANGEWTTVRRRGSRPANTVSLGMCTRKHGGAWRQCVAPMAGQTSPPNSRAIPAPAPPPPSRTHRPNSRPGWPSRWCRCRSTRCGWRTCLMGMRAQPGRCPSPPRSAKQRKQRRTKRRPQRKRWWPWWEGGLWLIRDLPWSVSDHMCVDLCTHVGMGVVCVCGGGAKPGKGGADGMTAFANGASRETHHACIPCQPPGLLCRCLRGLVSLLHALCSARAAW